jgi:hypothetical protein
MISRLLATHSLGLKKRLTTRDEDEYKTALEEICRSQGDTHPDGKGSQGKALLKVIGAAETKRNLRSRADAWEGGAANSSGEDHRRRIGAMDAQIRKLGRFNSDLAEFLEGMEARISRPEYSTSSQVVAGLLQEDLRGVRSTPVVLQLPTAHAGEFLFYLLLLVSLLLLLLLLPLLRLLLLLFFSLFSCPLAPDPTPAEIAFSCRCCCQCLFGCLMLLVVMLLLLLLQLLMSMLLLLLMLLLLMLFMMLMLLLFYCFNSAVSAIGNTRFTCYAPTADIPNEPYLLQPSNLFISEHPMHDVIVPNDVSSTQCIYKLEAEGGVSPQISAKVTAPEGLYSD